MPNKKGKPNPSRRFRRLVPIPATYMQAIPLGENLFSPLYQFENGLRLAIDKHLSACYTDWWNTKLRFALPEIHKYAQEHMKKIAYMPWIGDSARATILPIHHVTLGQLEEIVKEFRSDCIPQLFPTIEFFLGHMECIKRVRNLYSHMFPCLDTHDSRLAKREILTLSEHLTTRL